MATKMEICVSYVEEMNEKLGFKPKLPTEFDSIKDLKKRVKKEMAKYDGQLFIFDEEKVSEETWEFLTEDLDIEPRPKKEWASFLKAMEAEDASIPDDEAEGEDEGEEEEPTTEKEEREEDMATVKGKEKGKEKGKLTKKSIIIDLLGKKKSGVTLDEMAQAIVDSGIDKDFDKNKSTAKLWLRKIGFDTQLDKKTGKYKKVT